MNRSTLCVGADVHLDEIVLCAVDRAESHEVCERFRVTNNLPGAQAAATAIAAIAASLGCSRIEIGHDHIVIRSPGFGQDTTVGVDDHGVAGYEVPPFYHRSAGEGNRFRAKAKKPWYTRGQVSQPPG